jgi:S-adenosylmethionine decarboxylase
VIILGALGIQIMADLSDCNPEIINDVAKVRYALVSAARAAKATIIDVTYKELGPGWIRASVVIAESHIAFSSYPCWPGYAGVCIFTCGDTIDPQVAIDYLIKEFECKSPYVVTGDRGVLSLSSEKIAHKIEVTEPVLTDT